jgi:hypothetical protein
MAIFAGIFGIVGRFTGKLLTTALGWASSLLFGRVPRSRQIMVVAIMAGSAIWLLLVIGIVLPVVGSFLLAAAPIPDWLDEGWVRLAMAIGAAILPALIGWLGYLVPEKANRPTGTAALRQVLRGYPLAFVLSVVLVFLPAVALVRRVRSLTRGWSDIHVPIVAKPGGYDRTVRDLATALGAAGLEVTARPAPSVLAIPGELVARAAGGGVRSLLPDQLVELAGDRLQVGVYPSDIIISGPRDERLAARAAVLSRLATTSAYLTTTAEAQAIEDRLETIARLTPATADVTLRTVEFAEIDRVLSHLDVPGDEWDVLYRVRLQVERDLFVRASPEAAAAAGALADPAGVAMGAHGRAPATGRWETVAGIGAIALLGLDVLAVLLERLSPRRGGQG